MRVATEPGGGPAPAIGNLIAERARGAAEFVVRAIAASWLTPKHLTIVGFFLTVGVAVVIANGWEQLGGVLVILAGLFDMLDGALARVRGLKTKFGAFLDSTLDRFSEAALLGGVLWAYPTREIALLVLVALTGSLLVSYTRARAEGLGVNCEVGLLPRPQRIVLLAAGLITGYVLIALAVLAVFTNVTTIQRILHVRRALASR